MTVSDASLDESGSNFAIVAATSLLLGVTRTSSEAYDKNKERDTLDGVALASAGWKVITIWECELKKSVIEATLDSLVQALVSR